MDTDECEQDSDCQCKAGFYGNGKVCVPCKQCSANATTSIEPKDDSISCNLIGATSDWTTCTCNAGFYGDGFTCDFCTTCDLHAVTYGSCGNGSVANHISCVCNAGYYGSGTTCSPCPAGSFSVTDGEPCPAPENLHSLHLHTQCAHSTFRALSHQASHATASSAH